ACGASRRLHSVPARRSSDLVAIDYLLVGARRVEQTGRNSATHGGTMTDHGHQWYDARPPSDQQKGTAHVRLPDEVSSDGTAQLQDRKSTRLNSSHVKIS